MPEPDTPDLLWSVQRPLPPAWRVWLIVVACCVGLGGAGLAWILSALPAWWVSAVVGLLFAAAVLLLGSGGAHARLHRDGRLVYGHNRKDAWELPLAAVQEWRWIDAPPLQGIGMRIDPARIRFLHKRGLHYRMMERHEAAFGANVIAEWLQEADLEALRAWQRQLEATQPASEAEDDGDHADANADTDADDRSPPEAGAPA